MSNLKDFLGLMGGSEDANTLDGKDSTQFLRSDTDITIGGEVNGQGNYLSAVQNIQDMHTDGPEYFFDGIDDYIRIPGNINFSPGEGDFSVVSSFRSIKDDHYGMLFNISSAQNRILIELDSYIKMYLRDKNSNVLQLNSITNVEHDNKKHFFVGSFKKNSITGAKIYLDGIEEGIGDITLIGDIEALGFVTLGIDYNYYTNLFHGSIYTTKFFNIALDASDPIDKSIIEGGSVPYYYQGAIQTPVNEYTFDSSLDNWKLTSDDETSTLTWDTDHIVLAVTSVGTNTTRPSIVNYTDINTLPGKKVRVSFDYILNSGSCIVKGVNFGSGGSYYGDEEQLSQSGTYKTELIPNALGRLVIGFDGTNLFNLSIDNIKVTQIGCTLDLTPEGIASDHWIDSSGNNMHGEVSGAVAKVPGDTGWQDLKPYLVNDWVAYDDVNDPVRYRRIGNRVWLEGTVKSGTDFYILTNIPSILRPAHTITLSTFGRSDGGQIGSVEAGLITNTGSIKAWSYSTSWTSIACSYIVD